MGLFLCFKHCNNKKKTCYLLITNDFLTRYKHVLNKLQTIRHKKNRHLMPVAMGVLVFVIR